MAKHRGNVWLAILAGIQIAAWIGCARAGELESSFILDTYQQYNALVSQFTTTTVHPGDVYPNVSAQLNVDLGSPVYYGGFFTEDNFSVNPPFGQAEMFTINISNGVTLSATAPAPALTQTISCLGCYYGQSQYLHGQGLTAASYVFDAPGTYIATVTGPPGAGGPWTNTVKVSIGDQTQNVITAVLSTVRSDPAYAGKSEHDIAEVAFNAIVDGRQGFYGTGDKFAFLQYADPQSVANADHFMQAYASGTATTFLDNPLTALVLGAVIDPGYNVFKAIAQTRGYTFLQTGSAPQSKANFDFWALAGAKAAIAVRVGGQAPDVEHPLPPALKSGKTSFFYESTAENAALPIDPIAAWGFRYESLYGSLFSSIEVPIGSMPGMTSYDLVVGDSIYSVRAGETFYFTQPVATFDIEGFLGAFVGQQDFVSLLGFAESGDAVFSVTTFDQASVPPTGVPEPSSGVAVLTGMIAFMAVRRETRVGGRQQPGHSPGRWPKPIRLLCG